MTEPKTLFDKVWNTHEIRHNENGESLLWVDRHLIHGGSFHAFRMLADHALPVARPDLTFGMADHYVPTTSRSLKDIHDDKILAVLEQLSDNTEAHRISLFGLGDPRQGIVHVVGPELGISQPGFVIVCGDSHTSTHGALGAIGMGIGASQAAHVLATQTLWLKKPKNLRLTVSGQLQNGITAKDVSLTWISRFGANGASGFAIEYTGSAIESMSMEARLTLCNVTIEGGARCGMVAPDQTTVEYLRGRPWSPDGEAFEKAAKYWLSLATDPGASFDREIELKAEEIAPTVSWGTSPEESSPIDQRVPDPAEISDPEKARGLKSSLDYMGLKANQKLTDIAIDRVFIGSCTNARIEDLRAAAAVLKGRHAKVPGMVSPGSTMVKRQAESEGLDEIFRRAGLEWRESGCSMCVAMNGDFVPAGERCASSTNRNFRGRQGRGARTHIMSPVMVAAAAVEGHLADFRDLI